MVEAAKVDAADTLVEIINNTTAVQGDLARSLDNAFGKPVSFSSDVREWRSRLIECLVELPFLCAILALERNVITLVLSGRILGYHLTPQFLALCDHLKVLESPEIRAQLGPEANEELKIAVSVSLATTWQGAFDV